MIQPLFEMLVKNIKTTINLATERTSAYQAIGESNIQIVRAVGFPIATLIYCTLDTIVSHVLRYMPVLLLFFYIRVYLTDGTTKKYRDAKDMFCDVAIVCGLKILAKTMVSRLDILKNYSLGLIFLGICILRSTVNRGVQDNVDAQLRDARSGYFIGYPHMLLCVVQYCLALHDIGYIVIARLIPLFTMYCWHCVLVSIVIIGVGVLCVNKFAKVVIGIRTILHPVFLCFFGLILSGVRFGPEAQLICR